MTLTKANIVDAVAEQIGYTKNRSVNTIETLLVLIKRSLESGEDVLVSGFGKICVKEKHERRGRNPATGEDMMIRTRIILLNGTGKYILCRVADPPGGTTFICLSWSAISI